MRKEIERSMSAPESYMVEDRIAPYALLRAPEAELFRHGPAMELLEKCTFDIRRPMAPYVLPETPDWYADPYSDKTWRLYYHSLYWLQAFYAGVDEGRPDSSALEQRASDIAMDYVQFLNARDDDSIAAAGQALDGVWDDHATAYRVSHLAYIYSRTLRHRLGQDADRAVHLFAARHVEMLRSFLNSDRWLYSNHTLFQIEGVLDASMVFFKGTERDALIDFALIHYVNWVSRIVIEEEGTVREHATFYHAFLMKRILDFDEYARKLVGDRRMPSIRKTLKKMSEAFWALSVDLKRVPAIGDTKYEMAIAPKYTRPFLKPPYKTPTTEYLVSEGRRGKAQSGLTQFPQAGHYIMRQGEPGEELVTSYLDKPFIGPHGHADAMSFETFWKGRTVLADSGGPFKYGSQLRYKYFQKPVAHNLVVVGDGQSRYESRLQQARSSGGVFYIKGDAHPAPGIRWVRGLAQMRNHFLLVADILEGPVDEVGAYARFQPGLDFEVEQSHLGHARLVEPETGDFVDAVFLRDGFGHAPSPEKVMQKPLVVSHEGGDYALHEQALFTHADGHFLSSVPLRIPMTANALLVSIFAFGQKVDLTHDTEDGTHRFHLRSQAGPSYRVELGDVTRNGLPKGFSIRAELTE